jgi:hypothetical protein
VRRRYGSGLAKGNRKAIPGEARDEDVHMGDSESGSVWEQISNFVFSHGESRNRVKTKREEEEERANIKQLRRDNLESSYIGLRRLADANDDLVAPEDADRFLPQEFVSSVNYVGGVLTSAGLTIGYIESRTGLIRFAWRNFAAALEDFAAR